MRDWPSTLVVKVPKKADYSLGSLAQAGKFRVPAYLWVAVPGAVMNRGAIPVRADMADIDDTFCLDPAKGEAALREMSGRLRKSPAGAETAAIQ